MSVIAHIGIGSKERKQKDLESKNKGINFAEVTLHVGLGNFRSVDVEDLTKHCLVTLPASAYRTVLREI